MDINGIEIYEGDILIVYPENRQKVELESPIFEERIFQIRDDLPRKSLQDVVIDKGVVEYVPPAFQFKYAKEKENGAVSSVLFWGDNYEVAGNIFQINIF